MSYRGDPEQTPIIIAGILILLAFVIGSVFFEHSNPCLEWGPKYITRVDPQSGLVSYSQDCMKRTH